MEAAIDTTVSQCTYECSIKYLNNLRFANKMLYQAQISTFFLTYTVNMLCQTLHKKVCFHPLHVKFEFSEKALEEHCMKNIDFRESITIWNKSSPQSKSPDGMCNLRFYIFVQIKLIIGNICV